MKYSVFLVALVASFATVAVADEGLVEDLVPAQQTNIVSATDLYPSTQVFTTATTNIEVTTSEASTATVAATTSETGTASVAATSTQEINASSEGQMSSTSGSNSAAIGAGVGGAAAVVGALGLFSAYHKGIFKKKKPILEDAFETGQGTPNPLYQAPGREFVNPIHV